jgi:ABC-2 type transport system ATP-binding protein
VPPGPTVPVADVEPTASRALHVLAPAGDSARVLAEPLALRGICRSFGSLSVLRGVDLLLGRGEVTLVEGRNGAGKTTLLRVAAGLIAPDRGRVTACGLDPQRDRRAFARAVGLLSAGDRGLYARLTVRQNLEFCAGLALVPRRIRAGAVDRALARFALEDVAARRVDRISMGQRQRVRLATAFLHDPQVVLLDEPATSLDDEGVARLDAAVREVAARGGAVLCCAPSGLSARISVDRTERLRDGVLTSR